ncbi:MAG: sulfatase-like hydrolase/transferase [Planctomycetota bacterium]
MKPKFALTTPLALVLFPLFGFLLGGIANSAEPKKPNIILIMADDVSWECFGCYGAEDYQTPELDRLAKRGIQFSHCYSTPICTTSRVKIMTGQYNFRNYTHFGYLDPKQKTFGHLLQSAGYQTAIAGKWQLNGLTNSLPGSDDASRPVQAGFHEYMLWQLTVGKGGKKSKGGERFWSPPYEHNGKFLTKEMNQDRYGPDMLCDFVCDFIDRNSELPFFVYYPMVLVHDPFVPTPDTIGNGSRGHESNKPPKKDKAKRKENFVAMVNYMDKIVGRIVKKVDDVGELENTIILFTADNGTNVSITSRWNGRDIQGGKAGMKDMGTHVPLIAYWKGHTPEGKISNDLIDFTDFYTTFADASGTKLGPDDPVDGISFFPQLNGQTGNVRNWVFCHYQPYWNKKPGQFVRTGDYKLYDDGRLYRVPSDLNEATDLANSTDDSVQRIRDQLNSVLMLAPPIPPGRRGGKDAQDRPTYPDWTKFPSGR